MPSVCLPKLLINSHFEYFSRQSYLLPFDILGTLLPDLPYSFHSIKEYDNYGGCLYNKCPQNRAATTTTDFAVSFFPLKPLDASRNTI
jgi:hypothetical protein